MNTGKVRDNFKKFQILLETRCVSTIVTGRLVKRLYPEKYAVIKWHIQAVNINTNIKVYRIQSMLYIVVKR